MKINLGCGRVYKKGYVNVDAYDNTVADQIQEATSLRFRDNSVERIEACHVIEHLGLLKSIYALCECFRVLRPGGSLLIETPDLEATFRLFLGSGEKDKKELLTWIYGLDNPGLKHNLCFPSQLLVDLLKRTGFEGVRQGSLALEKNRPILRIACMKPSDYLMFQSISLFRKQLNREGIVNFSYENEALELESLIDFLIQEIKQYRDPRKIEKKRAAEIAAEIAIHNPKAAICFAKQFNSSGRLQKVLKELDGVGFPRLLVHVFKTMPVSPGQQRQTFRIVHGMGREAVRKLVWSEDKSVLESLSKTASEISEMHEEEKTESFSEGSLKRLSDLLFCKGAKEFTLAKYQEASEKFVNSILLFRDNILAYLNLARIMRISGNIREARENYGKALKLLTVFNYGRNSEIREMIETEQESGQLLKEPLVSIDDVK